MRWLRELFAEIKARRAGRRHVESSISRSVRDITGPTGWAHSRSWRKVDSHGDVYVRSFDPRVPPSLHVSARDRSRHSMPMPVAERCIEDWGQPASETGDGPDAELAAIETELND